MDVSKWLILFICVFFAGGCSMFNNMEQKTYNKMTEKWIAENPEKAAQIKTYKTEEELADYLRERKAVEPLKTGNKEDWHVLKDEGII